MKKLVLILLVIFSFHGIGLSQTSHLSLIYNFEGADFDHSVIEMVGTNDSLYIVGNTPDGRGILYRIDETGDGYEVIWEFDEVNFAPSSLLAGDTILYGTTRFSSNGGGTIFRYSLKDFSFKIIRDFDPNEVQEVQIKYITDSVLWLSSQQSFVDEGSLFIINKDGTGFKKIYNDTNLEKGQNPVDFVFHESHIYIACNNGGGNPYADGTGSTVSSGSIIRIKTDGTSYENLIQGGDNVGTQPQSLIIRENKLIGLFAYSGSNYALGGQFFRSELDGSSYDSLGALDNRALTKMLSTDSLIYGISSTNVFGINPFNGEIRVFDDLQSNPDFGYDVVGNPVFLNGKIFLAAQQGGPNAGGTILKWTNQDPEVNETKKDESNARTIFKSKYIDLNELFTDPEGDSLTYTFEYDKEGVTLIESKGILTVTPMKDGQVGVRITAHDGWGGKKSTTVILHFQETVTGILDNEYGTNVYPNPAYSKIKIDALNIESIEVLDINGRVLRSYINPGNEVDVSLLRRGVYFVRYYVEGKPSLQKIMKY